MPANGAVYTIRGTRGARKRRSKAAQDLHAEALEAERVQRELRAAFYLALDEGTHPAFAHLDVTRFAEQIDWARAYAAGGAAA